ncbi:MAG: hypothetical protein ACLFRW_05210 [Halorhodospira sp.]
MDADQAALTPAPPDADCFRLLAGDGQRLQCFCAALAAGAAPWRTGKTRIWRLNGEHGGCFVKEFYHASLRDMLRHRLRSVVRIYHDAEHFRTAGLPLARPLFAALGGSRWLPTGCLGLEAVPGPTLQRFLVEETDPAARAEAVRAVAKVWGHLTRVHGFHADPAPRNFVLREGDPEDPWLIDLESIYPVGWVPRPVQSHRLKKFALSAARQAVKQGGTPLPPDLAPVFVDHWAAAAGLRSGAWQRRLTREIAAALDRQMVPSRPAPQG